MAGFFSQLNHMIQKQPEEVFWRLFPFLLVVALFYLLAGGV